MKGLFLTYDVVLIRTRESTRHVKVFLSPYNRLGGYIYNLAHYMFAAGCLSDNVDQFTKFIGIVAT